MICTKCGTQISSDSKFCAKCGSPIIFENSMKKVQPKGGVLVKWQYYSFAANIINTGFPSCGSSASNLWGNHKNYIIAEGKNASDLTKELGKKGWELVSITPIAQYGDNTTELLYYFKKKIE